MARRHLGKVHRYKVTGFWGNVPDQIKELAQNPDSYCVDYWRDRETSWELMSPTGQLSGGWSGTYAGISPTAIAHSDGHEHPPVPPDDDFCEHGVYYEMPCPKCAEGRTGSQGHSGPAQS